MSRSKVKGGGRVKHTHLREVGHTKALCGRDTGDAGCHVSWAYCKTCLKAIGPTPRTLVRMTIDRDGWMRPAPVVISVTTGSWVNGGSPGNNTLQTWQWAS